MRLQRGWRLSSLTLLLSSIHSHRISAQKEEAPESSESPCSLCRRGESIPLEYQSKPISVPGFDFIDDCQTLETLTPIFQQNSEECILLQSIGTLCGCPIKENACHLCADGSSVAYGWREMEFLSSMDLFNGITPTCELVEAGLHSYNNTGGDCSNAQLLLDYYCGCGEKPGAQPPVLEEHEKCYLCYTTEQVPLPDKKIDIIGFPFETCGELAEASKNLFKIEFFTDAEGLVNNPCHVMRYLSVHCGCPSFVPDPCPICKLEQSYDVPFPDHRIDSYLTALFLGDDIELSCGVLADLAQVWSASWPEHASLCKALQGLGTQCGCTLPEEPSCTMCSDPLPQEMLERTLSDVPPYNTLSCGLAENAFMFMADGDVIPLGEQADFLEFECRTMKTMGYLCGCNDGVFAYWGADSRPKQYAAVWMQRVTAILSLVGSIAILVDIFKAKRLSKSAYHQIVFCLSFFDILSSISWGLGPLPTSESAAVDKKLLQFANSDTSAFVGSYGNDTTCKVQGFLLHLGFTSILYNMVLSYFFKLSIVNGWRDKDFTRRYQLLFLGIPALLGTGIAMGAIPFITTSPVACTIGSHKDPGGWLKVIGLFYLPYGPAFVYAPINTFYIYWKYRRQSRSARRWSFRIQQLSFRSRIAERFSDLDSKSSSLLRVKHILKAAAKKSRTKKKPSQLESLLLWQSFWYVCAFYCSYFIFVVAFALDGYGMDAYWFYIILSIFTPMQGLFNRYARETIWSESTCDSFSDSFHRGQFNILSSETRELGS